MIGSKKGSQQGHVCILGNVVHTVRNNNGILALDSLVRNGSSEINSE